MQMYEDFSGVKVGTKLKGQILEQFEVLSLMATKVI
jgi:hypothetical protein